jgi:hypothetical protein
VFAIEAALIAERHHALLDGDAPHPEGACAFLDLDDEGSCRIYEDRPYVCRTQGLPLRWLDRDEDGEAFEARDICPLNVDGTPLEELPSDALWTLGPFEQRLAERQSSVDGGALTRVALRDLFPKPAEPGRPRRRLPVIGGR